MNDVASAAAEPFIKGPASEFPPMPSGIYAEMPEDRYHAGPEVSVSRLKLFARAPLAAVGSDHETTRALHMGDVFHTLLLTPKQFDDKFCVTKLERISERENATKDEMARAAGRSLVKQKDYDAAQRMRDAVYKQSGVVRRLMDTSMLTEQSMFWTDPETGLACRGRADVLVPSWRAIIDIKTAADAVPVDFARAVANYKYHWQQAFYEEGMSLAGGFKPDAFIFIVIEKEAPFLTGVYTIEPNAIDIARDAVHQQLRGWAECARTGRWPGLPGDEVVSLVLPPWAYSE